MYNVFSKEGFEMDISKVFEKMSLDEMKKFFQSNRASFSEEQCKLALHTIQKRSVIERRKKDEEKQKNAPARIVAETKSEPALRETTTQNPPRDIRNLYKKIDTLQKEYKKKLVSTLLPAQFWDWMIDESTYSSIALEQAKETTEEQEKFIKICKLQDKNYREAFLNILTNSLTEPHLTHDIIIGTASTLMKDIEPEHKNNYRTVSVQMHDLGIAVQNPASIPRKMGRILMEIEEGDKTPIQKALDIHYNVIFVQPFIDTNKRTARLLANFYLIKNDYPPILIPPEQQKEYLDSMVELNKNGNTEKYERFMLKNLEKTLTSSIERLKQMPVKNIQRIAKNQNTR